MLTKDKSRHTFFALARALLEVSLYKSAIPRRQSSQWQKLLVVEAADPIELAESALSFLEKILLFVVACSIFAASILSIKDFFLSDAAGGKVPPGVDSILDDVFRHNSTLTSLLLVLT